MNSMNKLLLAAVICASSSVQAAGDIEAGKEISAAKCQACHGLEGNGENEMFPRLAGQYADYMVMALRHYRDGSRLNPIMAGQTVGLSEQDMQDVAAWFASQSGLVTSNQPRTISK